MTTTLTTSDIFHTSFDFLGKDWKKRAYLLRTLQVIRQHEPGQGLRGYLIKQVMKTICRKKSLAKKLTAEQIVDCFYDLKWLHEPWYDFPIHKVILPLSRGDAQRAEGSKITFLPPSPKLSGITYTNWKYLDAKFTKFLVHAHHKQEEDARIEFGKFLACLYLPSSVFHEGNLAMYGEALYNKFAYWERELILESYANCRQFIMNRFPNLFPSAGEVSTSGGVAGQRPDEGGKIPQAPYYTGEMWYEMHFDLAETPAFEGYEAAGEALLYDALGYLDKKVRDQNRQKQNQ